MIGTFAAHPDESGVNDDMYVFNNLYLFIVFTSVCIHIHDNCIELLRIIIYCSDMYSFIYIGSSINSGNPKLWPICNGQTTDLRGL